MSIGRYALGLAAFTLLCGSLGLATVTLRRRFLPDWTGAPARLGESVIALALLTGILEVLGTIGWFRLGPIVGSSLMVGLGTWRAVGGPPGARPRAAQAGDGRPLQRSLVPLVLMAVVTATVTAEWAGPTLQSYDFGIRTFDSLWYHLPWAASFAQTGQITTLHFTDVEYLTAFYPATAELFHGLGIVLFARDTLSPALNLAWLGLVLLAAYCIGRPRGLGPATLTGAALAMATPMMDLSQAGSAANDVVGVFFLLAAVALLLNAGGGRAPMLLAAVAGGLAIAVKLSLLAPVAGLTIGTIAIARPGGRRASTGLWSAALVLAGGFWYLRNLIAVGNPLPWLSLPALATPAAALQQHTAFAVAHYATDLHVWSSVFGPGLLAGLGHAWPAILIAAVVGPLLCVLPGSRATVRMVGLVALASIVAYLVTPESAAGPAGQPLGFAFNLRYAAPALTLALTILPLAPVLDRDRRRTATLVALALALAATVAQANLWPSRHLLGALGVGAGALAVAVVVVVGRRALGGGRRPVGRRALGGRRRPAAVLGLAALAALLATGAAGYSWQRHYLRGRYAFSPGVTYLARVWALFRHVHHARVGVVGTFGGFFAYPLFGLDDSNRVQYIAQRGANGSFTAIGSCRRWRSAVNAGRFRFLVSTPARDPWHPKPLLSSPEGAWTASDPAARLLYSRRAAGQTISVYELHGSLAPRSCP